MLAQAITDTMFKAQVQLLLYLQVPSSMLAQAILRRTSISLAQATAVIMCRIQVPLPSTPRQFQDPSSVLAQAPFRHSSTTLAQAPIIIKLKAQVPLPSTPRQLQNPSSMLAQAPLRHSSTTLAQATIIFKLKAQVLLFVTLVTTLRQQRISSRKGSACSAGSRTPTASPCVDVGHKLCGRPYADRKPLCRRISLLLQMLNSHITTLLLLRTNRITPLLPRTNQISILLLPRTYQATVPLTLTQVGATWALALQGRTTDFTKLGRRFPLLAITRLRGPKGRTLSA